MLINKKSGLKLAVLSLTALFGLTACGETDEIVSKPSSYDNPIITIEGNTEDIHHNLLSIIYDAMREASLSSKVLDEALYRYASSVFGYYNKVTAPEGFEEITLKEAYVSFAEENTLDKINAFIKEHKAYWNYNEEGKHVNDNGEEVNDEDFIPCSAEREHVVSKWQAIEARIAEQMFKAANSSSYITKNYYYERDYLKSLYENGESVKDYKNINFEKFIIPYTVEEDEAFEEVEGFDGNNHVILHREYYQSSVLANADYEATYVEDEIIPEIYNDLLIEQYLLDEDVAAVRNSRARKINVLKIEKYSSFTNNADKLLEKLISEIYTLPANDVDYLETDADTIETNGNALFEKYAKINKGLYDQIQSDVEAKAIAEELNGVASDVFEIKEYDPNGDDDDPADNDGDEIPYYNHTAYGDLIKDYSKIAGVTDWELLDESKYSTFTSSGTRSIEEGLEQQTISIMQSQSITKGWYIQSSTPTLDSNGTINDRLFKLSVANGKLELDEPTDANGQKTKEYEKLEARDRLVKEGGVWKVRSQAAEDENKFLCSINGTYYLKFEGQYSEDSWLNDIVYDDGSAYYVVQVLEAAKDSKLRNVSDENYAHTRSQNIMDEVIDEVAKVVGATGNYATLSKNHWLEKMDIKYHDQAIYDYFKANYPDLFED